MLRLSRYTHLFTRDGTGFVYNSRTNSFFELPESAFETLRQIDENGADACADDDFLTDLHRRKILTTQEEDDRYLNFLKLSYLSSAYSRDVLGLTILPTIACNLRCPYCFETSKPTGIMSDDVIDKLMEFIKINARNKKYAITWFGGEPLLGLDVIEKILERLEEEKDYIRVNHTLITNGTLLNQKAMDVFRRSPLDCIQITLDGDRHSHDSKRFFPSGEGSFDLIMANLARFVEEFPKTHVDIRINVDNRNKADYLNVCNLLKSKLGEGKVYPYPGILRANKGCEDETFFSSRDHLDFSKLLWKAKNRDMYPTHCQKGCCATSLSSHVIGPEGELYSCWEHVGDKNRILGYIDGTRGGNTDLFALLKLHGHCFDDPRCIECGLLPLCSGGCPDKRIRNLKEGEGHHLCSLYQENGGEGLSDALYEYYLSMKQ